MSLSRGKSITAVTLDEMVSRAQDLLPRLRERAEHAEQLRRIPDETIDDFRRAGLFRVFQPARYGGFELDYGATQLALAGVLGQGCGSSAWVQSVLACHAWILGMFPESVQDAVWAANPETLIGTSFSTSTGRGREVEGGYLISGQWQFASGVDACDWAILNISIEGTDRRYGRFGLVPRTQWEIVDTWFASGLCGSGSKDIRVSEEVFVPRAYTLDPLNPHASPEGRGPSESFIYRLPIVPVFPFNVASPALGVARGALEAFVQQTASRADRANEAAKQLRIAESSAEIDAGAALLRADAEEIARMGRSGAAFRREHEVRWKRDLAFAGLLWTRAVDRLVTAVGAHGVLEDNPIHRADRDIHAIANHIGLNWDLVAIRYGQMALGIED